MHIMADKCSPTRLWEHWDLVKSLIQHSIASRYRTTWFGLAWPVLQPILLIGIFSFVFAYVMPLKWVAESSTGLAFSLFLYSGLVVFTFFSEVISRAPTLVLERPNLVKKVVFPLEVLALVSVGTSLVFFVVNVAVFLLAMGAFGHGVPATAPLMLAVVVPFCLFLVGLSWFLSALTVYVRDVAHIVGIVVSATMFFTPVFFPLESAPESVRAFLTLNPLTVVIEAVRSVAMRGEMPDWGAVAILWGESLLMCWLSLKWFRRLRLGFSDVL